MILLGKAEALCRRNFVTLVFHKTSVTKKREGVEGLGLAGVGRPVSIE